MNTARTHHVRIVDDCPLSRLPPVTLDAFIADLERVAAQHGAALHRAGWTRSAWFMVRMAELSDLLDELREGARP